MTINPKYIKKIKTKGKKHDGVKEINRLIYFQSRSLVTQTDLNAIYCFEYAYYYYNHFESC